MGKIEFVISLLKIISKYWQWAENESGKMGLLSHFRSGLKLTQELIQLQLRQLGQILTQLKWAIGIVSSHCITRENTLFPNILQTETFCNNPRALLQSSPTFPNQHQFLLTVECSRAPWAGVCFIHPLSPGAPRKCRAALFIQQAINLCHQSIQGPCVPVPRVVLQTAQSKQMVPQG